MASLFYLLVLLMLVGGGLFSTVGREGWRRSLGFLVAWLGIFVLIFVLYSLRYDFKELAEGVIAEWDPTQAVRRGGGGPDGHFSVRTRVNGEEVKMLVDTGASKVILTRDHARRAGYDPDEMIYTVRLSTANGESFAARVVLDEVEVGGISLRDVTAYVNGGEMGDHSLLGMNFLERLESFTVNERGLELRGMAGR